MNEATQELAIAVPGWRPRGCELCRTDGPFLEDAMGLQGLYPAMQGHERLFICGQCARKHAAHPARLEEPDDPIAGLRLSSKRWPIVGKRELAAMSFGVARNAWAEVVPPGATITAEEYAVRVEPTVEFPLDGVEVLRALISLVRAGQALSKDIYKGDAGWPTPERHAGSVFLRSGESLIPLRKISVSRSRR